MISNKVRAFLHKFRHIAAVILVVLITTLVLIYQEQLRALGGISYLGAFITMLIGNATLFLPLPGLAFVYALGSQLNPVLIGLCAGLGGAIGELTGYLLGHSESDLIISRQTHTRIHGYVERYGLLAIFIIAIIPNPLFDVAGIAAGATKIKWWKFFLTSFAGITIKATLVALAGMYSLGWF